MNSTPADPSSAARPARGLNANAREWSFSASAHSFSPGGASVAQSQIQAAPSQPAQLQPQPQSQSLLQPLSSQSQSHSPQPSTLTLPSLGSSASDSSLSQSPSPAGSSDGGRNSFSAARPAAQPPPASVSASASASASVSPPAGPSLLSTLGARYYRSLAQTNLLSFDALLTHPYTNVIELMVDDRNGLSECFEFSIQHGALPALTVRYVRDPTSDDLVKPQLDWLLEDLDQHFPLVGVDAECGLHSVRVRLLQISTRTRCILFRIPLHLFPGQLGASLMNLLEDRRIHKSGAELWGDALDLYRDCGIRMNSCLNMSAVNQRGMFSLSLEAMTNNLIGRDGFVKDKETTISDWDAPKLSFRQLVYGALDAQTSYIVGTADSKPPPFHVSDLPRHWMEYGGQWFLMQKYMQREQEQTRMEVAVESIEMHEDGLVAHLKQYSSRIRFENSATLYYVDGSSEVCLIEDIEGKTVWLKFQGEATGRIRRIEDFQRLTLSREKEQDLLFFPIRNYLSRVIQGEEKFNPFIATILDLPFPMKSQGMMRAKAVGPASAQVSQFGPGQYSAFALHQSSGFGKNLASGDSDPDSLFGSSSGSSGTYQLLDGDSEPFYSPHAWWFDAEMRGPGITDYSKFPLWSKLNEAQRVALSLTDSSRVVSVMGGSATGKSLSIVAEVCRTLARQSSIASNSPSAREVQRVLVVSESHHAARHLCHMLLKFVPAEDIVLLVSEDFYVEWDENEYSSLLDAGVVPPPFTHQSVGNAAEYLHSINRRVIVSTASHCTHLAYNPSLNSVLARRQTVIFEEANQIWLLKAILLLRLLPHTERLLMIGDPVQSAPYVAREVYRPQSVLTACSNLSRSLDNQTRPRPFTLKQANLSLQYRMCKHIGDLVSSMFYDNQLTSYDTAELKGVFWRDVYGPAQKIEFTKSLVNPKESEEILKLWLQLEREGFNRDEVVILCFYEGQRQQLLELHLRALSIEAFNGQEAEVVILALSADFPTPVLNDRQRVNVAFSRAKQRLYIVGNRFGMQKVDGLWNSVAEFEQNEALIQKKKQEIPDMVNDFPTLGAVNNKKKTGSPSVKSSAQIAAATQSHNASAAAAASVNWTRIIAVLNQQSQNPIQYRPSAGTGSGSGATPQSSLMPMQHSSSMPALESLSLSQSAPGQMTTSTHPFPSGHFHPNGRDEFFEDYPDIHRSASQPVGYSDPSDDLPSSFHSLPHNPLGLRNLGVGSMEDSWNNQFLPPPIAGPFSSFGPTVPMQKSYPPYKSSLCRYYLQGFCSSGSSCVYAHGEQELMTPNTPSFGSSAASPSSGAPPGLSHPHSLSSQPTASQYHSHASSFFSSSPTLPIGSQHSMQSATAAASSSSAFSGGLGGFQAPSYGSTSLFSQPGPMSGSHSAPPNAFPSFHAAVGASPKSTLRPNDFPSLNPRPPSTEPKSSGGPSSSPSPSQTPSNAASTLTRGQSSANSSNSSTPVASGSPVATPLTGPAPVTAKSAVSAASAVAAAAQANLTTPVKDGSKNQSAAAAVSAKKPPLPTAAASAKKTSAPSSVSGTPAANSRTVKSPSPPMSSAVPKNHPPPVSAVAAAAAVSIPLKPWTCPTCTLENSGANKSCEACESERPEEEFVTVGKK